MLAQTCTCSHIHINGSSKCIYCRNQRGRRWSNQDVVCLPSALSHLKTLLIPSNIKEPFKIEQKWKAHSFNLSDFRRGLTYACHAAMRTGLSQDLTCWPWPCVRRRLQPLAHQHQNVWRLRNLCSATLPDHAAQHSHHVFSVSCRFLNPK